MSLADYPNQFAVFCHNSCTKLMADKRVWWIKRWRINENSLYICAVYKYSKLQLYKQSAGMLDGPC